MRKVIAVIVLLLVILSACNNKPEIITQFETEFMESYPAPVSGETRKGTYLTAALEHYKDKDVEYLVNLNLFDKNGKSESVSEEDKEKEYERLASLGYELYETKGWTYKNKNEKSYYDAVLILLTEEEIENLKTNEEYGYFLDFLYNGDHSPQDFEKCRKLSLKGE